jgi:hypothetical protein
VLDDHERAARLGADAAQQRPERLCLALRDPGAGLVEQQQVGVVGQ